MGEIGSQAALPTDETVGDGEWVLAIFEIGSKKRATAAAARGTKAVGGGIIKLTFERRDWDRLSGFVAARSEHMRAARPVSHPPNSSAKVPVAPPAPAAITEPPPTSRRSSDAPPRSRRLEDLPSSNALESSRVPFGARVLVVDGEGAAEADLRAVLSEMGLVVEMVVATTKRRRRAHREGRLRRDRARSPREGQRSARVRRPPPRARAPRRHPGALFFSSKPTSRDVVDAFASGGDDFLPKPFRTPELAARVFGLLRRARLARSGC